MRKVALTLLAMALLIAVSATLYLVPRIYAEATVVSFPCVTSGTDQELIKEIQKQFANLKLSGAFLIARKGEVLARGFCGTAATSPMTPITAKTQFNIGSVTKQFTGYLIHELVRDGKIAITAPLSQYIPELTHVRVGQATIDQIVKMRSGIPYILPTLNFLEVQLTRRIRTEAEIIHAIAKLDLEFQPGEKFSYSNLGYSLLGIVAGRSEDATWAESIHRKIFKPFGMENSTIEGETPERPIDLAVGFLPFPALSQMLFLALPHWNYSMIVGAGGIVTTVDDLHRWNQALTQRAAADPSWAKSYFPSGEPGDDSYPYGWFHSETKYANRTVRTINHGGEDPGYCAHNILIPEFHSEIILTTNSDYCAFTDGIYKPLTREIVEHLIGVSEIDR